MTTHRASVIALLATTISTGCWVEKKPPVTEFMRGLAGAQMPRRVLAFQSMCGSLSKLNDTPEKNLDPTAPTSKVVFIEVDPCGANNRRAVDTAVRSELEFRGYIIVDDNAINMITGGRTQTIDTTTVTTSLGASTAQHLVAEINGISFLDATPNDQKFVLDQLGVDGLLTTRIWLGTGRSNGVNGRDVPLVRVQVRLVDAATGLMKWTGRCELETSEWETTIHRVERASRCALAAVPR
jgi:hypothetical protein